MAEVAESILDKADALEQATTVPKEVDDASKERVRLDSNGNGNLPELPPEVWQEIFERIPRPSGELFPSRAEAPMSLTQTSSGWRKLALRTPRLWTDITIVVERSANYTSDGSIKISPRLELIEQRLQFSRQHPLSISVSDGYPYGPIIKAKDVSTLLVALLFQRLLLESSRWKSLRLSLPDISFARMEVHFKAITGLPALETLCLTTNYDVSRRHANSTNSLGTLVAQRYMPSQLWRNSPRLRQFDIHHMIIGHYQGRNHNAHPTTISGWATPASRIPFHQLTDLNLDGGENETVTIKELVQILQLSPKLVTCKSPHIKTESELPDQKYPILHLPHLRHLHLEICSHDQDNFDPLDHTHVSLTTIFTYFNAPSLVILRLGWDDRLDLDGFGRFLQRSSCSLGKLELYDCPLEPDDLITCLRLVPTLKSFCRSTLTPSQDDESEPPWTRLQELAMWDIETSQFYLCPLLEEITVDIAALEPAEYSTVSDTAFSDMIQARLERGGLLNDKPCFTTLNLKGRSTGRTRSNSNTDFPEYVELKKLCSPPFNLNLLWSED